MSVAKRGNRWWVNFSYQHQRYRFSSPNNSQVGAKDYESLLRQKLTRGENIHEKPREDAMLFSDFVKRWFETYVKTNNKPSEQNNKAGTLKVHLLPFFGKMQLTKIGNLTIEEYKAKKQAQGLCNKSINNHIGVLGKCLRCAVDWEILDKVPKIKPLKVPPQTFKFLNEDEYTKLLQSTKETNVELYEMVLFALRTGVRIGELIAVDWTDVDFINKVITIRRSAVNGIIGSPKNNRIRKIPMTSDLANMLYQRQKKSGFIFLDNRDQLHSRYKLDRALEKACKASDIKVVSWHPLRHSFASQLANRGVSIQFIQTLLGHSDLKMTQRYTHIELSTLSDAIKTLEPTIGVNLIFCHNNVTKPKITNKITPENSLKFSNISRNIT